MVKQTFRFHSSSVISYFDASFALLDKLLPKQNTIIVTDENVFSCHQRNFKNRKTIVVPAGEVHKTQSTVDSIIQQLIDAGADRKTMLIGAGGGVITDITGYVAGIYMRGIRHGFIPTSLLAMSDAAIGGKCGVDVGIHKNMAGLIKQPEFILYDYSLLQTLPHEEWINGFAEIIKHACIKDAAMFKQLEQNSAGFYRKNANALAALVKRNAVLKSKVVMQDEYESGVRKLLNFGHTVGHALEILYRLSHGCAIAVGMGAACRISEHVTGFGDTIRVINLLKQYELPPHLEYSKEETFKLMMSDKKRYREQLDYVVLNKVGQASVATLPLLKLKELLGA